MNEELNVKAPTENWTNTDWNKFSKWLKGMLKVSDVKVTFIKKDGSERTMHCTLDPKQLPPAPINENKKERKVNNDVVAVYDLEAKGWRSFTLKSIKTVSLSIG